MAYGLVNDSGAREQYTASIGETNFAYPFEIFADGDLDVWLTPNGQEPDPVLDLLVLNTDYTVTGAGAEGGGDVVLVVAATGGDVITIERNVPIERLADYSVGGDFSGASINQQLDKLTMTQQQNEMVNEKRQLTYLPTDELTDGDVNLPKLEIDQIWAKSAAGGIIAATITESTGWSILRAELANDLSGTDGARIVGYYSTPNSSTTVKAELDYLYNLIQSIIPATAITGMASLYIGTTAPTTWVLMDDGSIGDTGSGATTRANADCEDLFELIWDSVIDAWAPVSTGRGASAAADWAAGKTLTLTRQLGRAIAISGSGSGLTPRVHGSYLGEEDHALIANENGPHDHSYDGYNDVNPGATGGASAETPTSKTTGSSGLGTPHNTMQPSAFWNIIIKL